MKRKCNCELCQLSRAVQKHVLPNCGKEGRKVINEIWERMETAETDWDWNEAKGREGKIIKLGGRWYVPRQPVKHHRRRKGMKKVSVVNFDGRRT